MKTFADRFCRDAGQPVPPGLRHELVEMQPAVHGGLDFEELQALGLHADDILDFSSNLNPWGPCAEVRDAIANVPLDRYPDRECLALRAALAKSVGIGADQILPGNGASELIWLAALAYVRPGNRVLVLGPTFCEYARGAGLMGASVTTWRAREENEFVFELGPIGDQLESLRPRLVFLCNPNNPTGTVIRPETLASWAQQHPRTLFVVDEAYQPFAADFGSALAIAEANVLVLRSMTKDYGLAGLRLGYAVSVPRVIALLRRVQPPWSVNALAQAAGVAALGDREHRQRSLKLVAQAKMELVAGLTRLGLAPLPSATHFFLVRVGDGAGFRKVLLRHGVLVRDCASFGLPAYVRISTRRPQENERLLTVIGEEG